LKAPSEDAFVRQQLSGLLAFPTYYASMAPINRAGPALLAATAAPPALTPQEVDARQRSGSWVVDGRWRVPFARAHIPGSLNVELDDTFASYVGWTVPFGEPFVLVLPDPEGDSLDQAVTQLARIGYERIAGYLKGGMNAWRAAGFPFDTYRVAGLEELCRTYRAGGVKHLLDVRQRTEWDEGHVPESTHLFVGDLPRRIDEVPKDADVWAICATGHRAALAASLLDRAEVPVRLVEGTGVSDFLEHCLAGGEQI
jgi:rhodanese-related sulfurtransferase